MAQHQRPSFAEIVMGKVPEGFKQKLVAEPAKEKDLADLGEESENKIIALRISETQTTEMPAMTVKDESSAPSEETSTSSTSETQSRDEMPDSEETDWEAHDFVTNIIERKFSWPA